MRSITLAIILAFFVMHLSLTARAQRQAPSGWIESEAPDSRADTVQAQRQESTGNSKVLQGGIEHSVQLPALPNYLQVGSIFNQALLNANPELKNWYQIPNWLAGEWQREEETIVSSYDYATKQRTNEPKTIVARETAHFGLQADRAGGIWHCRIAAGGVADCGSYYSVALLGLQEPLAVSDKRVVLRDLFTELHVAKETNVIMLSLQAESITSYRPVRDGLVKTNTSVKFFEQNGTPKSMQKNLALTNRSAPFAPLNSYKGNDLRASFKRFLLSNGKDDLLPADR